MLDYGLDRVTNPNEVQVNQVGLRCILCAGPRSRFRQGRCAPIFGVAVSVGVVVSAL